MIFQALLEETGHAGRRTGGDADDETARTVGWEPVEQSGFAKWHAEAIREIDRPEGDRWPPGTYELIGPKISGNPEGAQIRRGAARPWRLPTADGPFARPDRPRRSDQVSVAGNLYPS
jgi:hypothetical protein